jgi:FMN phosphatase YigB (HAD superfamily)
MNKYMIVVFDFDLTLTTVHTGGIPNINTDYFGERLEVVKKILNNLEKDKISVYICTRGVASYVNTYVKSSKFKLAITGVWGATDLRELASGDWHLRKVEILDKICRHHKIDKSEIYFFDDTKKNIDAAKAAGYIHSIHVNLKHPVEDYFN